MPTLLPSACYGRASLRNNGDTGEASLDSQEGQAIQFAATAGLAIVPERTFLDNQSGFKKPFLQREQARRLFRFLKASPHVRDLVVTHPDRVSRDAEDGPRIMRLFKEMGVRIHFVNYGGQNLMQIPDDGFSLRLTFSLAQLTRHGIVSNISNALKFKRSQGYATGKCPFGKTLVATGQRNPKRPEKELFKLADHPEEQAWLHKMWAMRWGGQSSGAIKLWHEHQQREHARRRTFFHMTEEAAEIGGNSSVPRFVPDPPPPGAAVPCATYYAIAAWLNEQGCPTKTPAGTITRPSTGRKTTGKWQDSNVLKVLTNTATLHRFLQ